MFADEPYAVFATPTPAPTTSWWTSAKDKGDELFGKGKTFFEGDVGKSLISGAKQVYTIQQQKKAVERATARKPDPLLLATSPIRRGDGFPVVPVVIGAGVVSLGALYFLLK